MLKGDFNVSADEYSNLITTGLAMGLMSCIVNIGTVILQGAINGLGTSIITAHTAARRLFDILTIFLYSIGLAMTTYVSQNMGAGEVKRIKQGIFQAHIIVTVMTTVLTAICFTLGRPIIEWITSTDSAEIVEPAVMYMKISILFFYVLGPLFVMRCSLQGMGQKVMPVVSSITEMLIKIMSVIFLVPRFAYKGVAFTEPISWVTSCIYRTYKLGYDGCDFVDCIFYGASRVRTKNKSPSLNKKSHPSQSKKLKLYNI